MKLKGVYILACIFLLALPLSIAVKPTTTTATLAPTGLVIRIPPFEYVPYANVTANFHVYNSSFFILDNTTTSCDLHVYNQTGGHIINNKTLPFEVEEGEFYYKMDKSLFMVNKEYGYIVYCNNTNEAGFISGSFVVTDRLETSRPEGEANILLGIILIPLVFGIFLLVGAVTLGEEHGVLRIALYLLALLTVLASMHFAMVGAVNYLNLPELEGFIGTTAFWISVAFFTIVSYFMIYFILKIFKAAAQKREEKLEY